MSRLYRALRACNPDGILRADAIQLFLWIYCTLEVLPERLQEERLDNDSLSTVFEQLEADRLILPVRHSSAANDDNAVSDWKTITRELLLGRLDLDPRFESRVSEFFHRLDD